MDCLQNVRIMILETILFGIVCFVCGAIFTVALGNIYETRKTLTEKILERNKPQNNWEWPKLEVEEKAIIPIVVVAEIENNSINEMSELIVSKNLANELSKDIIKLMDVKQEDNEFTTSFTAKINIVK